jgi:copper chaperone CopZ
MNPNIPLIACALVVLIGAGVSVISTLTSTAPVANESSRTAIASFEIRGMTCAECANAVKMAAVKVEGVNDVRVSDEDNRAEVQYDPAKTTPAAIAKAITDGSGFEAELIREQQRTRGFARSVSGVC